MRILIVRLGSLGDVVHAIPLAAAIREHLPDAEITWVVESPHAPLVELVPAVHRIERWKPRAIAGEEGVLAVVRRLRGHAFDWAIDVQGLLKSAVLARLSGATRVVGFDRASLREPAAARFYDDRVSPAAGQHVTRLNLSLLQPLGVAATGTSFPITDVVSRPAEEALHAAGGDAALLNPGAAWPNKRWRPERFGALARRVHEQTGLRSIVTWGPDEAPLARAVVEAAGDAAVLAPPTRIADLAALLRRTRVAISGDTGPLHLAAAVGTPLVGLYGPTDPARNGPWDPDDIVVSRYLTCDCHYDRRCHRADWCLDDIEVATVVDEVVRRLAAGAGARTSHRDR